MLPVFTAAEMRALDARAVADLRIPGARLMEAAGSGAASLLARRFGSLRSRRVAVMCGKGNNGGDGFVAARRLAARGARVRVYLAGRRDEVHGDAAEALSRWRGPVAELADRSVLAHLDRELGVADLVVDALLGTGLRGPARGLVAEVIEAINRAGRIGRPVAALDVPSGVDSDRGQLLGPAVEARITATFVGYKPALLLHPACERAGEVMVIPIGIPEAEVGAGIKTHLLEAADARAGLIPRRADTHKGTYGHLLVVAGSLGKTGAAALAGRAGLRSGAGLVTVATSASQQPIVAVLGMETMTEALAETAERSLVALGPGLSLVAETEALARAMVEEVERPMVVDADALTALTGHLDVLARARAPRVLTPHPGEMARLLGTSVSEVQADRLGVVREFCQRHRVWLVLKGAHSIVGAPDSALRINPTGNPGMATGGTGDVLTGMIGAFLARGLDPLAALQAAVYLHGAAGDLAARARGEEGLIAGDILEHIPLALRGPV
jgi:hydroxyethylthiazole kinase-like uncharacterized protein yjeF